MKDEQWVLIAFADGAIRAGKASEQHLMGKKVLKLEQNSNQNSASGYRYYDYESITGIRPSSLEEINALQADQLLI